MEKSNVIVVHGAYGYPEENWFGWLKRELINTGIQCEVPHMPTPANQSLQRWIDVFNASCGNLVSGKTIIIGHSLGAAFVLRWLELYKKKILASILVGAFVGEIGINKFDYINKDFFNSSFDWQAIRNAGNQFVCYHGDNDPYVSKQNFDDIADNLKAKKIIISNAGHINSAAGYTTFPQLLIQLQQIMTTP